MNYRAQFPSQSIENKFNKKLEAIPDYSLQETIITKVEELAKNPRPFGRKLFKFIKPSLPMYSFTANFRLRIGDYRVLYDIDDLKANRENGIFIVLRRVY